MKRVTVRPEAAHWEAVYAHKDTRAVSWFEASPEHSLRLIDACGLALNDCIIDVGAGASLLVDRLLDRGYGCITLVDIARTALEVAGRRLAAAGRSVTMLDGDIRDLVLPGQYRLWHDRAVFHFLTQAEDREAYRTQLLRAVVPGGWLVLATFSDRGPTQCSNLPVQRYRPEDLDAFLGSEWVREATLVDDHHTPAGRTQSFLYVRYRRCASASAGERQPGP